MFIMCYFIKIVIFTYLFALPAFCINTINSHTGLRNKRQTSSTVNRFVVPASWVPRPTNKIPGNGVYRPGRVPGTTVLVPLKNISSTNVPCKLSVTKTSLPGIVCEGQILFDDNFDGDLRKSDIWTAEVMFPGNPDFTFNIYDDKARVEDGKLFIRPVTLESEYGLNFVRKSLDLKDRCTGFTYNRDCYRQAFGPQILPPIITAKVNTKNKFNFKYGRIEVRARMPLGDWLIPIIHLEPKDNVYGTTNYESGLIRIACVKGNIEYSKALQGGAILSESEPHRSAYLRQVGGESQWSQMFHNYSLVWSPNGITLFVDGQQYGKIEPGFTDKANKYNITLSSKLYKGTNMAPFDELFYISLGLDVGGIHEFPDSQKKPWSNLSNKAMLEFWNARDKWYPTWNKETSALIVDYVRVYAL